jgi:hypothetical protein
MPSKKAKKRPIEAAAERPEASAAAAPALRSWLERHSLAVALALILIATLRIVSTYTVFNHTSDEPNHIACGMEWLDKGTYTYETQHPPLARIAAALGPFLLGIRSQGAVAPDTTSVPKEGIAILYSGHHYDLTLALARAGILPFFWIACLVVYWWGRRYFDRTVAVAAVFLFSFLPVTLAHGGLATTDMALAAFTGAAFLSAIVWLEQPSVRNSAIFGACTALAVLSKLSAPVFLAAAFLLAFLWHAWAVRPQPVLSASTARRLMKPLAIVIGVAFLVIWAGYRFSVGKVGGIPLPAPQLFTGWQAVMRHNQQGHPNYLFGEFRVHGFWDYYLVVLAVKTQLAFLLLAGAGVWTLLRRPNPYRLAWLPLIFSLAILVVAMCSNINIGARHILPIYIGLSLAAAAGVARLWELRAGRKWLVGVLGAMLFWDAGASLMSHPDYLAYFNELAGSQPENILVDSNLDWGQDLKRLGERLRQAGAREVHFNQFWIADLEKEHGFPPVREMDFSQPSPGWNAVGLTYWRIVRLQLHQMYPRAQFWPDRIPPTERVGKSILLWYFPYPGE